MDYPNSKKVRPVKKSDYKHTDSNIYKVEGPPIEVAPGETVEILIPGSEGFSVYLPIGGHFNAQVYEAVENPAWAREEMEAAGGGGGSTDYNFWGVRLTRTSKAGSYPPDEPFPYCIYSKEFMNFAVGDSPPTMNLNP
jgi:hypothetical protein